MDTPQYEQVQRPMCTLTEHEKNTRKQFVTEYMKDRNPTRAAMRIGYSALFAKDFSEKFMLESYTLKLISDAEGGVGEGEIDDEKEKRKILNALWREANNMYSAPAARVAALAKLTSIFGMDAPTKSQVETTNKDGGMFVVPGIMNECQWTAQAAAQQEELIKPTSPPQLTAVK